MFVTQTRVGPFSNSLFCFGFFPPFFFLVRFAADRARAPLMGMTEWCASTTGGRRGEGVGPADGDPAVRVLATAGA